MSFEHITLRRAQTYIPNPMNNVAQLRRAITAALTLTPNDQNLIYGQKAILQLPYDQEVKIPDGLLNIEKSVPADSCDKNKKNAAISLLGSVAATAAQTILAPQ